MRRKRIELALRDKNGKKNIMKRYLCQNFF